MTFINFMIEYHLYPEDSEVDMTEYYKYYLLIQMINYLYTYNISDFIAIIPYIIRKRILKKKEVNIFDIKIEDNNNTHTDEFNSNLIYTNSEKLDSKKKKKEMILHLIII